MRPVCARLGALLCLLALLAADALVADEPLPWSYRALDAAAPPPLRSSFEQAWCVNGVDAFVLARLRDAKLTPAEPVSREVLCRRVSLVLTGLPPTMEELRSFLADESPDAYERLVDRLLASPRHGEHQAVAWLDLARYADTHGYHIDGRREMWRYRDWVIDALNQDLPFDQFTIEQLAGDLLPQPTLEQRIATGFLRNTMVNPEDGVIAEEFLAEYAAERTATVASVWLAQTLKCCRCHDHPHDPLTQRDFYSLAAMFDDLPEQGVDGMYGNAAPEIKAPTRSQQARLVALDAELAQLQAGCESRMAGDLEDARQRDWEAALLRGGERGAPRDMAADWRLDDETGSLSGANRVVGAGEATLQGGGQWGLPGVHDRAVLLGGDGLLEWVRDQAPERFTLSLWLFVTTRDPMTVAQVELRGMRLRLRLDEGRLRLEQALPHGVEPLLLGVARHEPLPLREWRPLVWTWDGGAATVAIGGRPLEWESPPRPWVGEPDELARPRLRLRVGGDHVEPADSDLDSEGFRGLLDEVRWYDRAVDADEMSRLADTDPLLEAAQTPLAERTATQRAALREAYLTESDPTFAELRRLEARRREERERLWRAAPTTMVMERGERRGTHLLERGDYRRPRDEVARAVPATLGHLPPDAPADRLALARWLVDRDHPLAARVVANRVWQQCFGVGLVDTPDDFGTRGAEPTHPELLDWLAQELVAGDWSVKRLERLLVTSATFRQDSRRRPAAAELDPANRLWHRGPHFPLPAESLRDSALAVGGLLADPVGGPSVFPYQPPGLWEELARDPDLYSAQRYVPDQGEGLYRRGIYTFWKRSSPPATLEILGAPSREVSVARRVHSEGPQRALALLNDPTFAEAARGLARRTLAAAEDDVGRIRWAFTAALARPPESAELVRLVELLGALRRTASAERREESAWTEWCATLLNLHEFQMVP